MKALEQQEYSIVLYDVAIGLERAYDMAFVERLLQSPQLRGVRAFNCSNLPVSIEPKRKADPDVIVQVEPDYFDFMAFYPRLAARVAETILDIEEESLRFEQSIDGLPIEGLTIEGFRKALRRLADRTHRDTSPRMPKNYMEVCDLAEQWRIKQGKMSKEQR